MTWWVRWRWPTCLSSSPSCCPGHAYETNLMHPSSWRALPGINWILLLHERKRKSLGPEICLLLVDLKCLISHNFVSVNNLHSLGSGILCRYGMQTGNTVTYYHANQISRYNKYQPQVIKRCHIVVRDWYWYSPKMGTFMGSRSTPARRSPGLGFHKSLHHQHSHGRLWSLASETI